MSNGNDKLNMSHTFTTHFLFGNLDTTTVTDNTLISDTLVFAAMALPITGGAEDALAEQAVTLGLVRTVVYGFRLGNLAIGTTLDGLGRRQANGYSVEIGF